MGSKEKYEEKIRTTQSKWFIFLVKARLSSRSLGGSIGSAQFSSIESSIALP